MHDSHPESIGYFGPDSITWKLYREPWVLVGGLRALLLQVAHPSVADGVAHFSQFKRDPLGRGYRTFQAMALIYFGTQAQARQTAQRLWHLHSNIKGEIPGPYTANQPDLLLWVHATLVDTTLQVFEQMPLPLPSNWRERFYEESKIAAGLLGIPKEQYPADLQAFKAYFKHLLEGEFLGSHPLCAAMAQAIVQHPYAPKKLTRLLATGWLPTALCIRLGLDPAPDAAEKLLGRLKDWYWIYRRIPRALRWAPAWHQAQYRLARARGERPAWMGRFFYWLGKRMKIPLGIIPLRPPASA